MTGVVLAVVATIQSWSSTDGEVPLMFAMALVAAIVGIMYWKNYTTGVAFAAGHSLVLSGDALLIRDGPTERRVPYDAIELLTIRRPSFGAPNFVLKVANIPADTFYGYEDIEGLISALASKIPRERVKGRLVCA
jgi:hypothetical protein